MKKRYLFLIIPLFILFVVIVAGVYRFNFTNDDIFVVDEPEMVKEGDVSLKDESVTYSVEFISRWSLETHPDNYPRGAHFSPFVVYSHNDQKTALIFEVNSLATKGVEIMAETGATKTLVDEISEKIRANLVLSQSLGKRIDSPGSTSSILEVSSRYSQVTFVSMLAPSPDWFVGASVDLFQEGQWVDSLEVPLKTYDAGSDGGEEFTSSEADTDPKELITIFDDSLQDLGTIKFRKVD